MGKLVKNSLGFNSNLFIYQDKDMFNYSIDTILLGNFVQINQSTQHILEVGTNNGALALFLAERYSKMHIDAIEIQNEAIVLAQKNINLNHKEKQIKLIHDDFNKFVLEHNKLQLAKYDVIVCNPPFYKLNTTIKHKKSQSIYLATHEVHLTLEQLIKGSSQIIKQKGYLNIVLPTERIVDAFELMRKHHFEPKRIQMIFPREDQKSNLVLIEARFQAGWGVHFLPNIYLHNKIFAKHKYRKSVKKLYKPIKFKGAKYE